MSGGEFLPQALIADGPAHALAGLGSHAGALARGVSTLEVRWILPGTLPAPMSEWFRRFPTTDEVREDSYLLVPRCRDLSIKIRGGDVLDVKEYLGSHGILDAPGGARGRIGGWRKWSFAFGSSVGPVADTDLWKRVRKVRTMIRFEPADGLPPSTANGSVEEKTCAVELTHITVGGEEWWTLGFEATGSSGRRVAIEAAAASLFDEPVPIGIEFRFDDSGSYSEWLRRRYDPLAGVA